MNKFIPKYITIEQDLRKKIERGKLKVGDRLPPEPELAKWKKHTQSK